ncbi:Putative cytoplasmic protein [Mucinivorans hirudinis]|uniref:Putative cytoplasmic protein n=1 Tax=Mucinivorans hirudinis TaxID=1433126 RepID=A0A060R7V7_9BACT|nr:Putative cytoplasmic protein [Mucinivorans hirudinis]
MSSTPAKTSLFERIATLIDHSKQNVLRTVNTTMVNTYFEIGRYIVEEQQQGAARAEYGTALLKGLAILLTKRYGKGFSYTNLEQMRKFYLVFSIPQTVSEESDNSRDRSLKNNFTLSWSHYLKLMRIEDKNERHFYEIEARANNWSLRELERQFDSALYQRLALSRDKKVSRNFLKKDKHSSSQKM